MIINPEMSRISGCSFGPGCKVYPFVNLYQSEFGEGCMIGPFCEVGGAKIGQRSIISSHSFIAPGVTIGDDTFVGHGVMTVNDLFDLPHHGTLAEMRDKFISRPTRIGNNVRIGSGAVILPVNIGDNCIIGAGAVVTHDVVAGATVAGVPARAMVPHPRIEV